MHITIALLQMTSCGNDQGANFAKGEMFCRRACDMGADIALFPEMWNIGYTPYLAQEQDVCDLWRAPSQWQEGMISSYPALQEAREQWQAQAITRDSPFITRYRELAEELRMAIAITYLEQWPGAPRNTVSLIDRHGEIVLTYSKIHTCDFAALEAACTPGNDFYVSELDTRQGAVKIGAMICFDREFPESARMLMLKGAELILTPNACPMEANRIGQFRARAYENMLGVALANYAAPQENGHSVAFDPIAFDVQGNSRDTLVIEAGEQEEIYLAPFDLASIRAYREHEVWGNAFRKPHRYGLLTSLDVEHPFIRTDDQGEPYDRSTR
ncbi:MAG TPA: carbon-nitrogen hydrolase family protein [Ktedonobacteraceae bacterium]|nr:carbon-nitrogen hydrolase family protein [Ktedonobacteraceae bacterium]